MSEPVLDPVTYRALEEVRTALLAIRKAAGFYTDIGLSPIVLEADQMPEDDSPYTLVLGTNIDLDDEKSTRTTIKSEMDVVIEFTLPFLVTENAQRVAHRGRTDIIRALIPLRKDIRDRPLGINSFKLIGSAIQQPEDGSAVVTAQVVARAGLTESFFNPAT